MRMVPKYFNISSSLQLIRGDGCLFISKSSDDDLESVDVQVSEWLKKNPEHPDAREAQRWLGVAASRIERIQKERQLLAEVAAFKTALVARMREEGDTWATWRVERYQYPGIINQFEQDLRRKMGLD